MKYTLKSAYGASRSQLGYKDVDVNTLKALKMNEIFNLYRSLELTLTTPSITGDIYIDFMSLKTQYLNSVETLETVLSNMPNTPLEQIAQITKRKVNQVTYSDAFQAGYNVQAVRSMTNQTLGNTEDLKDLRLSRSNTNMRYFADYVLVTVNGLAHLVDTDGESTFAIGAGSTATHYKYTTIGLISFEKIGQLKYYPIKKEMIFPIENNQVFLNLEKINTKNKSLIISLAGYLLFAENKDFKYVSDKVIRINLDKLPIIDRLLETHDLLKYPFMDIFNNQKDQVNINAFYQEKNLIEYLTLDQSFIITVDTDNLHLEREAIKNWPLPGMLTCYKEPKSCLMATTGRLVEYYKLYEDGHYSVNVNDSFYRYRQDESVDWLNRINATEQKHPYQPYYDSKGVFLHIYSETKV